MKKRKANRYARGNRYEVKVKRELEKQGWVVYKPVRTRFSQKDILGLFDLLVYNPEAQFLMFLQLTTDRYIAKHRAEEKLKNFDVRNISFMILTPEIGYSKNGIVRLGEMSFFDHIWFKNTASEGGSTLN